MPAGLWTESQQVPPRSRLAGPRSRSPGLWGQLYAAAPSPAPSAWSIGKMKGSGGLEPRAPEAQPIPGGRTPSISWGVTSGGNLRTREPFRDLGGLRSLRRAFAVLPPDQPPEILLALVLSAVPGFSPDSFPDQLVPGGGCVGSSPSLTEISKGSISNPGGRGQGSRAPGRSLPTLCNPTAPESPGHRQGYLPRVPASLRRDALILSSPRPGTLALFSLVFSGP